MRDFFRKSRDVLVPSVVLLTICIIIPFALAFTNQVTKDRIAALEEESRKAAMSELIEADTYRSESFDGTFSYTIAEKNGETIGYIFETSKKGYGGDVSVMTAVTEDGVIGSIAILDVSNETPGLGQNAAKEGFYSQYAGKVGGVVLKKNGANADQNEVDAVTGATITSTAVTRAVNEALEQFEQIRGDLRGE